MRNRVPTAFMVRLILSCGIAVVPLFGDSILSTGPGGAAPTGDGPGPGQVLIYSNFGPGGSFQTVGGWGIGPGVPPPNGGGVNNVLGQSFTIASTLRFADAQLVMFAFGGTSAAVYLESNDAGVPGTILDTLVEQSPIGDPPSDITFNCQLCPLLSAGGTYWIVAAEGNGSTAWSLNSTNDNSGVVYDSDGSAIGPWNSLPGAARGAFEVDGVAPVPEPSSITLLAAAVAVLSFVLRRKMAGVRRQAGRADWPIILPHQ